MCIRDRYEAHKGEDKGFGTLPDLILLDGGKGHVGAVKPVVDRYGYDIPVFGMVKDSHHRTRAIALDGGEIAIGAKRSAFTLVSTICLLYTSLCRSHFRPSVPVSIYSTGRCHSPGYLYAALAHSVKDPPGAVGSPLFLCGENRNNAAGQTYE